MKSLFAGVTLAETSRHAGGTGTCFISIFDFAGAQSEEFGQYALVRTSRERTGGRSDGVSTVCRVSGLGLLLALPLLRGGL